MWFEKFGDVHKDDVKGHIQVGIPGKFLGDEYAREIMFLSLVSTLRARFGKGEFSFSVKFVVNHKIGSAAICRFVLYYLHKFSFLFLCSAMAVRVLSEKRHLEFSDSLLALFDILIVLPCRGLANYS